MSVRSENRRKARREKQRQRWAAPEHKKALSVAETDRADDPKLTPYEINRPSQWCKHCDG